MNQNMHSKFHASSEGRNVEHLGNWLFPGTSAGLKTLLDVTTIVTGWFSVSLEVFTRSHFGERYLGVIRLLCGWSSMSLLFYAYLAFMALFNRTGSLSPLSLPITILLPWIYVGFALYQRRQIRKRNKARIPWHSMSFGVSRLAGVARRSGLVQVDSWMLYCTIEPGLWFLLGVAFAILRLPILSVWLIPAAFSMFVHNSILQMHQRNRILDMHDAQIEAEYFQAATEQKPMNETAGLPVIPALSYFAEEITASELDTTVEDTMRQANIAATVNAAMQPQAVSGNGRR